MFIKKYFVVHRRPPANPSRSRMERQGKDRKKWFSVSNPLSPYPQHPMHLQREPPAGILHDSLHARGKVGLALRCIFTIAGLQEAVFGFNFVVNMEVLSTIDHFELVAAGEHAGLIVAALKTGLRRERHPIQRRRQRARAVRLNGHPFARPLLQCTHEGIVHKQRRLAAREHHHRRIRISVHLVNNVGQRHHPALLVLRVAKDTVQVAPAEAHKHRGRAAMVALALQGVEYLVDLVHLLKILHGIVHNVGCLIVARLPHIRPIAVGHRIHNPLGQILGRRVEVEFFV